MIDIETLSTRSDAAILSIGAVFFDIDTGKLGDTFHTGIKIRTAKNYGHIDPETIDWWFSANHDALGSIRAAIRDAPLLMNALFDFSKFLTDSSDYIASEIKTWANSPSFDIVILNNAYKRIGLNTPFKYHNECDLRTLIHIAELNGYDKDCIKRQGIKHNALHDAIYQSKLAISAYKYIIGEAQ